MITFVKIDESNFKQVIDLKVKNNQNEFVSSNLLSLAEAYVHRLSNEVFPYAIYNEKELVGFILLDLNKKEKEYIIWRLMIDFKYQNSGIGKKVIKKTISDAIKAAIYDRVVIDFKKENIVMESLLRKLGFIEIDDDTLNNEVTMAYELLND